MREFSSLLLLDHNITCNYDIENYVAQPTNFLFVEYEVTFCIEFFLFTCHEKKEKVPKILQEALLNFRQMMELSSKQMDQNVFYNNSVFFSGFSMFGRLAFCGES